MKTGARIVAVLLLGSCQIPTVRAQDFSADDELKTLLDKSGIQGGIVVCLGCGEGARIASLYTSDAYTVHGLIRQPDRLRAARAYLKQAGLYGPVSVELLTAAHLPYSRDLINLVIAEDLGDIPESEVLRVLVPNGVGLIKQASGWKRISKPRSPEIDEWTHFLHDASNNAVAQDTQVAPPRSLRWQAAPLWLRSRETPTGLQAAVTGQGRLFYILDSADPYAAFEGRRGAYLSALSATHGREMTRIELSSPPVFDGMIAAHGRLFVSLRDGRIVCLQGSQTTDRNTNPKSTYAK